MEVRLQDLGLFHLILVNCVQSTVADTDRVRLLRRPSPDGLRPWAQVLRLGMLLPRPGQKWEISVFVLKCAC